MCEVPSAMPTWLWSQDATRKGELGHVLFFIPRWLLLPFSYLTLELFAKNAFCDILEIFSLDMNQTVGICKAFATW